MLEYIYIRTSHAEQLREATLRSEIHRFDILSEEAQVTSPGYGHSAREVIFGPIRPLGNPFAIDYEGEH
jgi:hypothetical protein